MSESNPEPKSMEGAEPKSQPRSAEKDLMPVARKPSGLVRFLIILVAAVIIYLVGYVPMSLEVRQLARQREAARANLRPKQLQLTLASAALDARRGEYELARKEAATFFTTLSDELRETNPIFDTEQRTSLEKLLRERDELITLLARSDPASAERFANLYVSFRDVMEKLTVSVRH